MRYTIGLLFCGVNSSLNCMDWFLLPPASDAMIEEVSKATKGRFMGDPSFVYEHQEIHRQGKGNEPVNEKAVVSVISAV